MKKYITPCLRAVLIIWTIMNGIYIFGSERVEAGGVIKHTGFAEDSIVQSYVQHAYDISGGDMDFITTLEAENGLRDPTRQSNVIDKFGIREDSRGFCQYHRAWHKDKVDDPRFFSDPYRQLEKCYEGYMGGTTFYGYYVRHGKETRFTYDGVPVPKKYVEQKEVKPAYVQPGNPYKEAKKVQDNIDRIKAEIEALPEKEREAIKKWRECIDEGFCIEKH